MVKKFFWYISCFIYIAAGTALLPSTLTLRFDRALKNDSGDVLLPVGRTARLTVTARGEQPDMHNIEIQNLAEHFTVSSQQQSHNSMIINGRHRAEHAVTFSIVPRHEGRFSIGPAQASIDGQSVVSNDCMVMVTGREAYQAMTGTKQADYIAQAELKSDATHIVIGQAALITISCRYSDDVRLASIEPPSFGALQAEPVGEPKRYHKAKNGRLINYYEQKYKVRAHAPDVYTIMPATVHFTVPAPQSGHEEHDMFGGHLLFQSFFGGGQQHENEAIVTNQLRLLVDELPAIDEHVGGIGRFERFMLYPETKSAKVGEPITIKAVVAGTANFETVTLPQFTYPPSITLYQSGATVLPHKKEKEYRYIMQVDSPGKITFPAQKFLYFDPEEKAYKTIKSKPFTLEIFGERKGNSYSAEEKTPEPEKKSIDKKNKAYPPKKRTQPVYWGWYVLLVVLFFIARFFKELQQLLWWVAYKAKLFSPTAHFRKQFKTLLKAKDFDKLHQLFSAIIAYRYTDIELHDHDIIAHCLEESGWDTKHIEQFVEYSSKLREAAFAPDFMSPQQRTALLKKAEYWLEMLLTIQ